MYILYITSLPLKDLGKNIHIPSPPDTHDPDHQTSGRLSCQLNLEAKNAWLNLLNNVFFFPVRTLTFSETLRILPSCVSILETLKPLNKNLYLFLTKASVCILWTSGTANRIDGRAAEGRKWGKSKELACSLSRPLSPNFHVLTNLETLNPILLGFYGSSIT